MTRSTVAAAVLVLVSGCVGTPGDDPSFKPTSGTSAPNTADDEGSGDSEWDQMMRERIRNAFADLECPAPRDHDESFYQGPMIDTHVHVPLLSDGDGEDFGDASGRPPYIGVDITVDEMVCVFVHEGTESALSFFSVFPAAAVHHLELANLTRAKYPDRFHPFISPPDSHQATVAADALDIMLDAHPGLFRGLGELGLYPNEGDPDGLPPDDQRLRDIYPVLGQRGLLAYFHLGEGHQEAYERVVGENPGITFIFHGDQLITHEDGHQNLTRIEQVLSRHPNVRYTVDELYGDEWLLRRSLTKDHFLAHFDDYAPLLEEDLATWGTIIQRHPDQFMWGTDRGGDAAWSLDRDVGWTLNDYGRAFIARLDPNVQENYAYRNAQRLFEP